MAYADLQANHRVEVQQSASVMRSNTLLVITCLLLCCFSLLATTDAATSTETSMPPTTSTSETSPELKKAWEGYYAALEEMRVFIENTPMFQNPQSRAKAYHGLMEMQAFAYNLVIAPRREKPRLLTNTAINTDLYTLGLQSPSSYYAVTFLDGRQTYRLTGRMGDITFFSLIVQNNIEENSKNYGSLSSTNMLIGKDGTYEIVLGGKKQPGNWVALDPDQRYHYVLIRRTVPDLGYSDIGHMHLERVSPIEPGYYDADEFDESVMAERIRRAEKFIRYMPKDWMLGLYDKMLGADHTKNSMHLLPGTASNPASEPTSNYTMGVFSLQADEALIISMDEPPDGAFWDFQLGDVWSRALPYYDRQSSLNMAQAVLDSNGGLTLVVSLKDPGVANWLDPVGRNEGEIVNRNYGSKVARVPRTRLVKLNDLKRYLPSETKMVSPAERQKTLEHRREGVLRMYGNY